MKKYLFILVIIAACVFAFQIVSHTAILSNKNGDIYLYSIKINDKLPVNFIDRQVYLISPSQNSLKINLKAQNAKYASFYEGNELIKKEKISHSELSTNINIKPTTNYIKLVLLNSDTSIDQVLELYRSNITLNKNDEVLSFINDKSNSYFLIGKSDPSLAISKYKNLYLYKENSIDWSGQKVSLPQDIISGKDSLQKSGEYILVDIPTDKLYDTLIHRGLIYKEGLNGINVIWDSEGQKPDIQLVNNGESLEVNIQNHKLDIGFDNLSKKYGNQSVDKNSFDIKGINSFSLQQENNEVYLKVYYSLYNKVISPVLDAGNIVVNYKIDDNNLILSNAEFKNN